MIDKKQTIISVDEYKAFAGIEGKKQDAQHLSLIEAASAFIKARLAWEDEDYKEYDEWPADIKLACCQLVQYYYKNEYRSSLSAGGMAVSYTPGLVPNHIYLLLANYMAI